MKLYSFLKNLKTPISKLSIPEPIPVLTVCKMKKISDLPGAELGIPLNIFQYMITYNHYGYNIINTQLFLLQFLLGFYTYGKDRYYDAIESEKTGVGFENKKELYNYILNNKFGLKVLLDLSFFMIIAIIIFSGYNKPIELNSFDFQSSLTLAKDLHLEKKLPFIFALLSTDSYSKIKENYGFLKSIYVASMWTMSTVILPSVIHDQNFNIIYYPLDYLPVFSIIFSSSNLLDIRDIDEDRENGIRTFPVLMGANNSKLVSIMSIILSSILIFFNGYYSPTDAIDIQRIIINIILEIQNLAILLQAIKNK